MKLPLREMRRRPNRFVVATVVLSFLATLLMFLGGLLDGLYLGSTGAIRAQQADAVVFSQSALDSFLRSRITADERAQVGERRVGHRYHGLHRIHTPLGGGRGGLDERRLAYESIG